MIEVSARRRQDESHPDFDLYAGGGVVAGHPLTLESAVAEFGRTASRKLTDMAARGEPEDQLRAPLEKLASDLAALCGHRRDRLNLVGETSLGDLQTRPDYAVTYARTL